MDETKTLRPWDMATTVPAEPAPAAGDMERRVLAFNKARAILARDADVEDVLVVADWLLDGQGSLLHRRADQAAKLYGGTS